MVRFFFICVICSLSFSLPQKQKTEVKQKELDQVRKEIKQIEAQVSRMGSKEKKTFGTIEKYNKQIHLLNQLITELQSDAEEKEAQIGDLQSESESLNAELIALRKNYAAYVTAVYQRLFQNKLLYFFTANSISQALLRQYYLKTFSQHGKTDAERILTTQIELRKLSEQLTREKNIKQAIILQKSTEENVLDNRAREQKSLLAKLKGDKTQLQKELDEKKRAEQRIRDLVNKLIARDKERKRQRDQAEKNMTAKEKKASIAAEEHAHPGEITKRKSPSPVSGPITALRGKMGWPANGSVLRHYGESKNAATKTVTLNYGVDIKTSTNAAVKSIYSGEVSAVEWLPGYRTIIIISHGHDFRTVYGNLGTVKVREGDRVDAGTIIGSAGSSIEGSLLHFEVWNDRQSQNPEIWLARK